MSTSHITNRRGKRTHLSHRLADCWGVFALAAGLADLPHQRHNRVNSGVQRFPALDLGNRVKRHAACCSQLFHLRP